MLLEGLAKKSNFIGKEFNASIISSCPGNEMLYPSDGAEGYDFFYALSYCDKEEEMKYLLDYLKKAGFIHFIGGSENFQVTVKGFEKAGNLPKNSNSKTAFIAMWITSSENSQHETLEKLRTNIYKAVSQAGYDPVRIDKKDHIKKIDDQILVEINKSRFVVCDFTSEKEKPRGSVYFEAGYAMGNNIDIIWTCNKELSKEMAFDIRQYNCLFWERGNMEVFADKLQNRIENAIGEGPLKRK